MSIEFLVVSLAAMAMLTFTIATVLAVGRCLLFVPVDPRVGGVEHLLPQTNCGGCGYPGCKAFAKALVTGEASPIQCSVGTDAQRLQIAEYLGVDVGTAVKRVARLACAGGSNVAGNRAHYQGHQSCSSAATVSGGGKACFWGCIGLGDCHQACGFDAIRMSEHHLPQVDEARCTACGDCVQACPKDLFSIHDACDRLWIACASMAEGDSVLEDCEVACTACGRCAMDSDSIEMKNGRPVIDYRSGPLDSSPSQRCPTGAIVWLDADRGPIRGRSAAPVIRRSDKHDSPT